MSLLLTSSNNDVLQSLSWLRDKELNCELIIVLSSSLDVLSTLQVFCNHFGDGKTARFFFKGDDVGVRRCSGVFGNMIWASIFSKSSHSISNILRDVFS